MASEGYPIGRPWLNPQCRKPWSQPNFEGTSWSTVDKTFPTEDSILSYLFDVRFGNPSPCPKCGRMANWYRIRSKRCYSTNCCGGQAIFPMSNTLFDKSRTPLRDWLHIMLLFSNTRSGIAGHLIQRHFGLTYSCAHKICDRVRTHMALIEGVRQIGGPGELVYVDEAVLRGVTTPHQKGTGRAIIMGMTNGESVATAIIPNRKIDTLMRVINDRVVAGSIIVTDGFSSYRRLAEAGWERSVVFHSQGIYVNHEGRSQAAIEAYWGVLKRVIRSTYLHMSRENLWKYLGEFNFRYCRRRQSYRTFWDMISQFPPLTATHLPPQGLDYVPRRWREDS